MNDCEKLTHDLSAYLDGELDAASATRLHDHLAACAPCRGELKAMEKLETLLQRSRESVQAVRAPRVSLFPVTAAAAAVLLIGIVFLVARPVDVRELVGQYVVAKDEATREALAQKILSSGDAGLRVLVEGIESPQPEFQIACAKILARSNDPNVTRYLLTSGAAHGALGEDYDVLTGSDGDLDHALLQAATQPGYRDFATRELSASNLKAMLLSGNPELIRKTVEALDNCKSLKAMLVEHRGDGVDVLDGGRVGDENSRPGVNLGLMDLVEHLDSPELGDVFLENLKFVTKNDFGKDKERWRAWIKQAYPDGVQHT